MILFVRVLFSNIPTLVGHFVRQKRDNRTRRRDRRQIYKRLKEMVMTVQK